MWIDLGLVLGKNGGQEAEAQQEAAAERVNLLVDFYANDPDVVSCCLCFYSQGLPGGAEQGARFLRRHAAMRKKMARAVDMKRKNERVLTSRVLEREGIRPGPKMGKLLSLAQALSAQEDIFDEDDLLARLKGSSHWGTGT